MKPFSLEVKRLNCLEFLDTSEADHNFMVGAKTQHCLTIIWSYLSLGIYFGYMPLKSSLVGVPLFF